jgi:2-hydroxychromene-2-carboxylate isomerase
METWYTEREEADAAGSKMNAAAKIYYDFRSPYAYFASHRLRNDQDVRRGLDWNWRPVSIDVLLNLQAGRDPWAAYIDPLAAPKRAHLIADVRRLAAYYDLPLRSPRPARPNSIPALCLSGLVEGHGRAVFIYAVFDALWERQQDISDPQVLADCLSQAGARPELLPQALDETARTELELQSRQAYARGIFGVPSFAYDDEIFFGNDRLDLLLWTIKRRSGSAG